MWRAVSAALAIYLSTETLALGQTAVRGVYLLPVGNRASLVVELETPGSRATVVEVDDPETFVVDIGPVAGTVAEQMLRPAPSAPIVREVSVRGVSPTSETTWDSPSISSMAMRCFSMRRKWNSSSSGVRAPPFPPGSGTNM